MAETYSLISDDYPFLKGGGEMGQLTRSFDWINTTLGTPAEWPQSLKTTLSIILNSRFPMFLWWGPELICFYNDAYRPSLGSDGKHPSILGMPGEQAWPEIWDVIKPLINQVLARGEATWSEDQLIPIIRNGKMEDVYWTFSYSPVTDESGRPAGVFVTCTETTEKVIAYQAQEENIMQLRAANDAYTLTQRKIKESEDNLRLIIGQAPVAMAIFRGPEYVVEIANTRALELWYRCEEDVINRPILEVMTELISQGVKQLLDHVYETGETFSATELPVVLLRNGQMETAYINFVYEALYDADGAINGIITIGVEVTEQVLVRKKIQESEERFRTMAEGTDVLIAVGDESSNAVYFNKAWTDLTGRTMEHLLQFGWVDLVHPDDQERYVNIYLSAFKEKVSFTGEFRVLDKKGTYRWLLATGPPRFRSDGSFAGYISSCIDITERKEAEEKNRLLTASIKASEQRLDLIIKQLPARVAVFMGPELVVETTNDALLTLWNKEKDKVIGKPLLEILPELKWQPFPDELKYVMETGESIVKQEIPVMLNGTDGENRHLYVDYFYQPLTDITEERIGVLATSFNVTDKVESRLMLQASQQELQAINKEMAATNEELASINEELTSTNEELAATQQNLQESLTEQVIARTAVQQAEEMLRMALEAANIGTWFIHAETRDLKTTPRLNQIFGYEGETDMTYDQAIGQVTDDFKEGIVKAIEKAITDGGNYDFTYTMRRFNDNKLIWLRSLGKLNLDDRGELTAFSGVVMDITEQRQDELRKNDFIGMVSHELKTPLTSLTAIVQVLNAKLKTSADPFVAGAMDKANIQVKKMSNMINGFLNISRLESGKIMIIKQHFELNHLISEMIDEVKVTTSSHTISLLAENPVEVYADRDKIGSVISNLLSNAIKYSPKGKTVEVHYEIIGDSVQVMVNDEGMGIKPNDVEKLFERYYRVENKHTMHISGFGIGLYLSAEIIERHDGRIWVESESGVGSTFYFTLPLLAE